MLIPATALTLAPACKHWPHPEMALLCAVCPLTQRTPQGVRVGMCLQKHSPQQVPIPALGSSCHHYFAGSEINAPIHQGPHPVSPAHSGQLPKKLPRADVQLALPLTCVLTTRTSKAAGVGVVDGSQSQTNKTGHHIKFRVSSLGTSITSLQQISNSCHLNSLA